jgi:hypothetical protein
MRVYLGRMPGRRWVPLSLELAAAFRAGIERGKPRLEGVTLAAIDLPDLLSVWKLAERLNVSDMEVEGCSSPPASTSPS